MDDRDAWDREHRTAAARPWWVGLLVCLLCLAGCGARAGGSADAADPGGRTSAADPVPAAELANPCLTAQERTGAVTFRSGNGALLAGVQWGSGPEGVVLAHTAGSSLCDWAEYARTLADRGAAVLAFDLNGSGLSEMSDDFVNGPRYDEDVVAAVRTLRDRGVESVALAGASLGATAAVVAAAELGDEVDRVAELSGQSNAPALPAMDAAADLRVPLLCIAGEEDAEPAQAAERLCDAANAAPSSEVVVAPDTSLQGTYLLDPAAYPGAEDVRTRLTDFLTG